MSKIFVRRRRHAGKGAGRPRFTIVAVKGSDLEIFKSRIHRAELETLAAEAEVKIVYLPRGKGDEAGEGRGKKGGRHHRRKEHAD